MEFIIEIVLEFLVAMVWELFADLIIHFRARNPWLNWAASLLVNALVLFGFGLICGLLSLLFFPRAFVRSESLHGISLVITPVLAGLGMAAIGWIRERRGKLVTRLESFSYGFVLAFGIALIRFYFTN